MDKFLRLEFKITKENNEYVFCVPYGVLRTEALEVAHEIVAEIQKEIEEAAAREKAEAEKAAAESEKENNDEVVGEDDGSNG